MGLNKEQQEVIVTLLNDKLISILRHSSVYGTLEQRIEDTTGEISVLENKLLALESLLKTRVAEEDQIQRILDGLK